MWIRRGVLSCFVLCALAIGAIALHKAANSGPSSASANTPRPPCMVGAESFWVPGASAGFTAMTDQQMSQTPFHSVGGRRPEVTDFVQGRLEGFLSNTALMPVYRQQEDAVARSLNYDIGKWPLLPLSGAVVHDTPGLLEFYETHLVFSTSQGAISALGAVRASAGAAVADVPELRGLGSYQLVIERRQSDTVHENSVGLHVVIGKTLVQLVFQGGADINGATVTAQVNSAIDQAGRACPGG